MKRKEFPKIDISIEGWLDDQCFCNGENAYAVKDLWEAVADLPIYEVPIIGMNTNLQPWDNIGEDFHLFLKHVALVNDADLSYPIILDPDGNIADGRHRLAKAIIEGHTTIKIKRLKTMPESSYVFDEDGEIMDIE